MTTYIKDIFDLPDRVRRGDFVLKLSEGVNKPDETINNYVVTPQLAESFDAALDVIKAGIEADTSKGCYLHGSFGSGKSHFMAILNLILQGNASARSIPELAGVISKHNDWTQDKKFVLVPYHMIGKESMEQAIFGGYVDYVAKCYPGSPVPGVYKSDELFRNAAAYRENLGDEKFFAELNAGRGDTDDDWGDLAEGWSPDSFKKALNAPPTDDERTRLVGDLVDRFFSSAKGANEFVDLDTGLSIISRHACSLGYDAVILFLDELILWLASRAADVSFVNREGPKLAKLVEAQSADRPIPLISFVARQRDLKELIGDNVTGAEYLSFSDALDWWEARFATIKLEDKNLPAIANKRVLRLKTETARQALDKSFEETTQIREEVMNILLTNQSDREMFRSIYPFSPAFMNTLIAMSFLLQRERTALKVMLQILISQKDYMTLGEIIPVGDLYDAIAEGDEAVSDEIRRNFDNARKIYEEKLKPVLEEDHKLTFEDAEGLGQTEQKVINLRNDDRIVKTLLLAALAPNVEALRGLTAKRLAALNHGTIKSPIPGHETQVILTKCRNWAAKIGQIKMGDEPANPTISIHLSGVDIEGIIDQARSFDNRGNRIREIKKMLFDEFGITGNGDLFQEYPFVWRGTKRNCNIKFDNIRDMALSAFQANGENWRIVIDRPFDDKGYGPKDDKAKLTIFNEEYPEGTLAIAILPSFLNSPAMKELGKYVIILNLLKGDNLSSYTNHLTPADRQAAKSLLENQLSQLKQQMIRYLESAYGISTIHTDALDPLHSLELSDHFHPLAPGFELQPPVGANLKKAFTHILDQALSYQFPEHPKFDDDVKLSPGILNKVFSEIAKAAQISDGRSGVDDKAFRKDLRRIVNPLKIGTMEETHFILGHHWKDHFIKKEAEYNDPITVRALRDWMDEPKPMGLPGILQDLIIMTFAVQTNRSFYLANQPIEPVLDKLDNQCELKTVDLPAEADWNKTIERAGHFFGITQSPLINAGNVASFSAKVHEIVLEHKDNCSILVDSLTPLTETRDEFSSASPRFITAAATHKLITDLQETKGRKLVEKLAKWKYTSAQDVPVADAAIGTSLKKSGDMIVAIKNVKWDVIETAGNLEGNQLLQARKLIKDLDSALVTDEYAVALKPKLSDIENRALKLIQAALDEKNVPVKIDPPISPPEKPPVDTLPEEKILETGAKDIDKKDLDSAIQKIREVLNEQDDVRISLTWKIYKPGK